MLLAKLLLKHGSIKYCYQSIEPEYEIGQALQTFIEPRTMYSLNLFWRKFNLSWGFNNRRRIQAMVDTTLPPIIDSELLFFNSHPSSCGEHQILGALAFFLLCYPGATIELMTKDSVILDKNKDFKYQYNKMNFISRNNLKIALKILKNFIQKAMDANVIHYAFIPNIVFFKSCIYSKPAKPHPLYQSSLEKNLL